MAFRFRHFDIHESDWIQARRLDIAKQLDRIPGIEIVGLAASKVGFWLFPILIKNRDNVVKQLEEYDFSSYCSNSQLDVVPVSKELMDCCEVSPEVEHIANDTLYIP